MKTEKNKIMTNDERNLINMMHKVLEKASYKIDFRLSLDAFKLIEDIEMKHKRNKITYSKN